MKFFLISISCLTWSVFCSDFDASQDSQNSTDVVYDSQSSTDFVYEPDVKELLSESEILNLSTQDMYEEEDGLHVRAVEDAAHLITETQDNETINAAFGIMELGMKKSEKVREAVLRSIAYAYTSRRAEMLDHQYQVLTLLEKGVYDPSEGVQIRAIKSAADIIIQMEDEDVSLQMLSVIARGLMAEDDQVQRSSVQASVKVIVSTGYPRVSAEALHIMEGGMRKSSFAKRAVIQGAVKIIRRIARDSELYETAFRFLEWGKSQETAVQIAIIEGATRLVYSRDFSRAFDLLEWGMSQGPKVRRDVMYSASRIVHQFSRILSNSRDRDSSIMDSSSNRDNNMDTMEGVMRDLLGLGGGNFDVTISCDLHEDDGCGAIVAGVESRINMASGLLHRGLLDPDDEVRWAAEEELGRASKGDRKRKRSSSKGDIRSSSREDFEGFEHNDLFQTDHLSEREKLNILIQNMREEEDNIHSKSIREAARLATSSEDIEIARRALDIVEQGLALSEQAAIMAVMVLGPSQDTVLESKFSEITHRAMQVIEEGGSDPREYVIEEAIRSAQYIAENTEDEELVLRALSVIKKGIDEESDGIQYRAVSSAGEIALLTRHAAAVDSALSIIELGKRKSSWARDQIISMAGKFIGKEIISNQNHSALQRALDLLEWGKTQDQLSGLQKNMIEQTHRIRFELAADEDVSDRIFELLEWGIEEQNSRVRRTTVSSAGLIAQRFSRYLSGESGDSCFNEATCKAQEFLSEMEEDGFLIENRNKALELIEKGLSDQDDEVRSEAEFWFSKLRV